MADQRAVLVTGAGGFIGGRTVEVLLQREDVAVRAGVRRWSTAARIGRYPITPVAADLMQPAQLHAACEGVDAILHCAVGDATVTVEGTRRLLEAAMAAGVRRVVHVSTIDVYGRRPGTCTEDLSLAPTGRPYGDAKLAAERVCAEYVERGLDVVIVRPTIVYGPHSESWTVEFAQRLVAGTWTVAPELAAGICNLVYVDDVVRAMLLAMDAPGARGQSYNVNGRDNVTWHAYVSALNAALGLPPLAVHSAAASRSRAGLVDPVRALVKGAYKQFQGPVMSVYKRSHLARRMIKRVESALRAVPSRLEFDLYSLECRFPIDRARTELGYEPATDMARGIDLSVAWLRFAGLVP